MSLILKSSKELLDRSILSGELSISLVATIGVFISSDSSSDWPIHTFEEANVTRKSLDPGNIIWSHVDVNADYTRALDSINFDERWTFQASDYSNINLTGVSRPQLILIANNEYLWGTYPLSICEFPIKPFKKFNVRSTIQDMIATYQHNGTRPFNLYSKTWSDISQSWYGLRTYPWNWSVDVVMADVAIGTVSNLFSQAFQFQDIVLESGVHYLHKDFLKVELSQSQLNDWLTNYTGVTARFPDYNSGGFKVVVNGINGYLRLNGVPELQDLQSDGGIGGMSNYCCGVPFYIYDFKVSSHQFFDVVNLPFSS